MRLFILIIWTLLFGLTGYTQKNDSTLTNYEGYIVFEINDHTFPTNSHDTAKVYLSAERDRDKSYNLDFTHITCGEIFYFSIRFENGDELFFERYMTGEDFIDSQINYVSGFQLSNRQFKKYKNLKVSEFKFFIPTYCKTSEDFYFKIWKCEFKCFYLSQLKFKNYNE